MAKRTRRRRPGKCVHCLMWVKELTDDHVFPKSWYPLSTPKNLAKWKIPDCSPCNGKHGRNENELLLRLGKHFDPGEPEFGDIADKSMRATDPGFARDTRDAHFRTRMRVQLRRELFQIQPAPGAARLVSSTKAGPDPAWRRYRPASRPARTAHALVLSFWPLTPKYDRLVIVL